MTLAAAPRSTRPWLAAAVTSAVTSASFLLIYGGVNVITEHRARFAHIPTAALPWELRYIPFVPAMILPYVSLDPLFAVSFFLCSDKTELRTHTRRLWAAELIACAFFLVFPLTSAFPRTLPDGFFASAFRLLWVADRPYNMAPSLHLAFQCLLLSTYARHTRGVLRATIKLWFLLIGVSTVLTHQHQLLDVVAGQLLGVFCLYVFPDRAPADALPAPLNA